MFDAIPDDIAVALAAAEPALGPYASLRYAAEIGSTNDAALALALSGAPEGTSVLVDLQTRGRGRRGHDWFSPPESGLYLSVIVRPRLAAEVVPVLTLAAGIAAAEAIQELTRLPIELKWPNDIVIGRPWRKLGGILVETASFVAPQVAATQAPASPARYVVVGIGINVLPRSPEGMSMPPGSLQEVEPGLDAPTALQRIVPPLVAMLQSFAGYGFAPMQPRFAARDVLQGRAVTLSDGHTGTAHGVGDDGALLVHTAGGMQAITSSEISVRPTAVPPV